MEINNFSSLKAAFLAKEYSGITGIAGLIGLTLLTEIGSSFIGGGFWVLYITFHFILNPIIAFVVIMLATWHSIKSEKMFIKVLDLIACVIPATIIHSGVTGSFWLSEILGVTF